MDLQSHNLISKILKFTEINRISNDENRENLENFSDLFEILRVDNPIHSVLLKNLNSSLVEGMIKNQKNDLSTNKAKIKYKSRIKTDQLESVLNLSLWKNAPSTTNLFDLYEMKKNNFKTLSKNSNQLNNMNKNGKLHSENLDLEEENQVNKKFRNNFKYNNKLHDCDDERDQNNDTSDKFHQTNNYMSYQVNLKRKNNSNIEYENYTNSIYNVNKKKNNKKNQGYNKFNRNDDEEEEEAVNEPAEGFRSAINEINKRVFKKGNNNSSNYNYNKEDSESYINNNNNKSNKSFENEQNNYNNKNKTNTYKKFNPPVKSNEPKKLYDDNKNKDRGEKEKELDEKLKGFDRNLIEFIESEILSYNPNVKWEDIAGLQFAKKTIKEIIIWPLLRPDIFNGIRRPPKGLLLFGPPGTGKTMIAKAIASESNSKFFNISASSLMSKWIGESEKLVRTLFALASFYQPSVVFIDEIDSILTARSENECEASRRLKTEFLVQLDGAGTNQDDRILIIGATNRPQEIDDAFIRRLAKRLYIPLPNFDSRKQLINTVINKEKEKSKYEISGEDLVAIVEKSKGYSGSDMMGVCREAAMMPIRSIDDIHDIQLDNLRGINLNDFYEALNLVKPSVSEKTISQYVQWNKDFGSFQFDDKENDN